MNNLVTYIGLCAVLGLVSGVQEQNVTNPPNPAGEQLTEFRRLHPEPIGVLTRLSGEPLDIRDTTTLNSDLFNHRNHFRLTSHNVRERTPERIIFAKGAGAFGYFEVTDDVSEYIKSDVFNGIGTKTPVTVRFSTILQNLGGSDLARERKGMSVKFYTKQGNLDFVCSNIPVFLIKDPMFFSHALHAYKRNPRTDIFDFTARWDFTNNRPTALNSFLWTSSDFGLPDGWRRMDGFAKHAYIIYNTHGEKFYVKFNFRTEAGLQNLSDARAQAIGTEQADYYQQDLYNAIALKNFPAWKLEMDILKEEDLMKVSYDPFDVTRLWKKGTYHTVPIGRLVLNKRVDNHFSDIEQSAFSPDNLVPGIFGPVDALYRARKVFYVDAQNYRLGSNFDRITVNAPLYSKVNSRDGVPPLMENMRDAPNYFPNSFNGAMPYVDEVRPFNNIEVFQSKATDLEPMADFYNEIIDTDDHRQRIANIIGNSLRTVPWDVEKDAIRLLTLVSKDLGKRVRIALDKARAVDIPARRKRRAQCIAEANRLVIPHGVKHHLK